MDPLLLWMTGGPGASSLLALYEGDDRPHANCGCQLRLCNAASSHPSICGTENGPFRIANNLMLASNHWGWDTNASIIYLDQARPAQFIGAEMLHTVPGPCPQPELLTCAGLCSLLAWASATAR